MKSSQDIIRKAQSLLNDARTLPLGEKRSKMEEEANRLFAKASKVMKKEVYSK